MITDNIIHLISEKLNQIGQEYCKQNKKSDSIATLMILGKLGELGKIEDYDVCISGIKGDNQPGWLYDMVWYKNNSHFEIESTYLVLESEMSYGLKNIKYDFEKLLLSNSDYRIMICCLGKQNLEDYKNYFERAVKNYKNLKSGEKVHVFVWDDCGKGNFLHFIFIK